MSIQAQHAISPEPKHTEAGPPSADARVGGAAPTAVGTVLSKLWMLEHQLVLLEIQMLQSLSRFQRVAQGVRVLATDTRVRATDRQQYGEMLPRTQRVLDQYSATARHFAAVKAKVRRTRHRLSLAGDAAAAGRVLLDSPGLLQREHQMLRRLEAEQADWDRAIRLYLPFLACLEPAPADHPGAHSATAGSAMCGTGPVAPEPRPRIADVREGYAASPEMLARLFAYGLPVDGNPNLRRFTFDNTDYVDIQAHAVAIVRTPIDPLELRAPVYEVGWQGYTANFVNVRRGRSVWATRHIYGEVWAAAPDVLLLIDQSNNPSMIHNFALSPQRFEWLPWTDWWFSPAPVRTDSPPAPPASIIGQGRARRSAVGALPSHSSRVSTESDGSVSASWADAELLGQALASWGSEAMAFTGGTAAGGAVGSVWPHQSAMVQAWQSDAVGANFRSAPAQEQAV